MKYSLAGRGLGALLLAGALSFNAAPCVALAESAGSPDASGESITVSTLAQADAAVSGTWGTCAWDLDAAGTLTVHAGKGAEPDAGDGASATVLAGPFDAVRDNVKSVVFENGVVFPRDSSYLFYNFKSLETVEASGVDTSGVESMNGMFFGCTSLKRLDLSSWNTSSLRRLCTVTGNESDESLLPYAKEGYLHRYNGGMFSLCESLEELNLSGWDVSNVKGFDHMFEGCSSLVTLDLSSWDVSNAVYAYRMFKGCSSLSSLNVAGWNTSSMKDAYAMFAGCSTLPTVDVSGWNVSGVRDMRSMFEGCTSLAGLNVSKWDTSKVEDMCSMFRYCAALKTLDISGWDTSSVTDMSGMFYRCVALDALDVSGWDTSKVTDLSFMFRGCISLDALDVSGWDTSSVTDMNALFMQCRSLKQLDVSHWDTSKVKSDKPSAHDTEGASEFNAGMNLMFENCSSLRSLDLSSWDTTGVTQATHMFDNCGSLESVTVGEKYAINSADMVPEPLTTSGWWSTRDGKWISKADIVSGRSGVADLYLGYAATFSDVTGSTAHVGDIAWLAFKGISKGWETSDGTVEFRPYANVARADMAAFLFRLAKSWGFVKDDWKPSGRASFVDVSESTAHHDEILWLAESGISQGWETADGGREFRPYAEVARADMAAFLHRLAQRAGAKDIDVAGAAFIDVDENTAHAEDIAWLAMTGVSKGWDVDGGKEFRPYASIARADMAAFLHRLDILA